MTGDPLYRPLGMEPQAPRDRTARRLGRLGAAIVLLAGLGSAAAVVLTHHVGGDGRVAVVPIEVARESVASPDPAPPRVGPAAAATATPEVAALSTTSGTSIEVQNGVKIIRFNGGTSPGSVTIPVGGDDGVALAPAPDARVSEKTADGVLPRIGPTGSRASSVYARHDPDTKGPRIALVLVGVGRDAIGTVDTIRQFPPVVGIGYAPEVGDAARQVAEARRDGHEAFLDLREGGGTQGGSDPARNLRRRLGRWSGYVGVVLDPGARPATAEEVQRRGVFSIASAPAGALSVTRSADVLADAGQGAAALDAAMARLVDIARAKGSALGVVDHVANGATGLAAALAGLGTRGVTLVPASALLSASAGAVDASR